MTFSAAHIAAIATVIGPPAESTDTSWFWNIQNKEQNRAMAVSVNTVHGQAPSQTIISVQTHQGYVELHAVTGFVLIEPDEVMFIAKHADRFSGMVIGRSCTCSQFANVDSSLLRADFSELDPSLLMAAMQMSLAESELM